MIEPENAAELAQAINQLAANPAHAAALGQKGREQILRHFSPPQTAEKEIQILESLLEQRQSGATKSAG